MQVIYKCVCMSKELEITVTDRRPTGSIEDWMEMVQHCISVDHRALHPRCTSQALEYAKIPIEGSQIGTPPTRQ